MSDLLSICYVVMFFVILLWRFIFVEVIEICKKNSISRIYQIIVLSMLNNWNCIYYSQYIIIFVGFVLIYYVINLNIVSLCFVFSNLYF